MKTIVLVACVKNKAQVPHSAKNLYISPWFEKAKAYTQLISDEWHILSAKHHLLHPDELHTISPCAP